MNQMKILSVDDNPQNLKLIQLSLEETFEVLSNDGIEPIADVLERFKPDVILLDIMLGDKSGYDVCREIRQSNICPDVIVIFISSLSSLEDKITAYGAGGDDYVCKPIDIQELDRKLHSLEKRIAQQQDLEEQYEYASQAAFSSMQQSSELGLLIAFFTDTMEVNDCDTLFDAANAFVKQFGSHSALEFRLDNQIIQYPKDKMPELESEILELGRGAKRIISFGNNLLLNSKWCSLLIKKMPINDADLCGRLRDHYAILLGIIDSRLMLIESNMNREKVRENAVVDLSSALDKGFELIKRELSEQEKQAQAIVQQLESSMSISLVSLGLSEEQEETLLGIVEDTRESFESMVGLSIHIDNEICQLDRLLGKIV
jgi:DNA-binding response OmpR family regulator